MPTTTNAICVKCKHHTGDRGSPVWWQHHCHKFRTPVEFNWVTGRQEGDESRACREVNTDGRCDGFVPMTLNQKALGLIGLR